MILVTGGSGQLGTALRSLVPDGLYPGRADLDLVRVDAIPGVVDALDPTAIVNCAAYTAVDAAETDEDTAHLVNAVAVGELARCAAERSIPFVTVSTDYVFDGTASRPYVESDPTGPLSAYGRTKLAGERRALAAHPGALVVRTSWVVSASHRNFVSAILDAAAQDDSPIPVVADQRGCPTIATDLAGALLDALDRGVTGVLHVTNSGSATRFGLARAALGLAGGDPDRVVATTTADHPRPARRPAYSVLGSERQAPLGLTPLPPWEVSLAAVVGLLIGERP